MRHRVTYVHADEGVKPLKNVNSTFVELDPKLTVAREDKFTYKSESLSHIAALRIQISRGTQAAKNTNKSAIDDVFSYNFQTGVHVYAVPKIDAKLDEKDLFFTQLNDVLTSLLGINVPVEQWVRSLNSFYFHTSENLQLELSGLLERKESSDSSESSEGSKIPRQWDALDYYYSDSQSVLAVLERNSRRLTVNAGNISEDSTEVGIFHKFRKSTRDDLILSGIRVTMDLDSVDSSEDSGTSKYIHKTMFHVKPRHRHLEKKLSFGFRQNGLHPVVNINDLPPAPLDDDIADCKMYGYFTLEKSVFMDPYQIPREFKIVTNFGSKNLELPEYSLPQWGNEILLEVADNTTGPIDLTLHSRYQLPHDTKTHTVVNMDYPVLFYACDVKQEAFLLKNSPFDTKREIGGSFEKFFTEETVFYHFSERNTQDVMIPNAVGNADSTNIVTFAALLIGLGMILRSVYRKATSTMNTKVSQIKKNE